MVKILVTFALRQEGVSFERRLAKSVGPSGAVPGHLDSKEIAVDWLGPGFRDQDRFEKLLSNMGNPLVINSGFAGATRTLLEPGDFVLAENFSSPELLKRLEATQAFQARGKFVCVDKVVGPAEKSRINAEDDVLAIDMESERVAAVCRNLSVPLVTARMISDRADEEIPGVFLGKGVRRIKDISAAITFASRMIALRPKLADHLVDLINLLP